MVLNRVKKNYQPQAGQKEMTNSHLYLQEPMNLNFLYQNEGIII